MNVENSRTIDEMKIRTLIDGRAKALSIKNAADIMSDYSEDYIEFSLAPPLARTANVENLELWLATWRGGIGSEVRDLKIVVSGDAAFSYGLNRMTGTKTDGVNVDLWFRETLCFLKTDRGWKIVHEHSSVPFYMDGSFRAAIDLKP